MKRLSLLRLQGMATACNLTQTTFKAEDGFDITWDGGACVQLERNGMVDLVPLSFVASMRVVEEKRGPGRPAKVVA